MRQNSSAARVELQVEERWISLQNFLGALQDDQNGFVNPEQREIALRFAVNAIEERFLAPLGMTI
jgi:hypothetical protein